MSRRRPLIRSPLTRLLVLSLLIAAGLAGWLGVSAVAAQHQLVDARASLAAARVALLDRRVPDAAAAIAAAGRHTTRARELTSDPIWRAVADVPWAGRSLREVAGVAIAADDVSRSVLPPSLSAARLLTADKLRRPDGSVDVTQVRRAAGPVRTSAERLRRIRGDVNALPRRHVVGTVLRARDRLASQLDQLVTVLDSASTTLALAPALLGADRPRTFFVLVQQTSEARGTGGLPGGFAILRASGGKVRVLQSGSNADLRNGAVAVPAGVPKDYVATYGSQGAFTLWQNINLSPDLPVVARVVAQRWRAQGGAAIDGVAVVDAHALALILKGSPPVAADRQRLTANNLENYLGIGQYAGFGISDAGVRKDHIAEIARVVADRLTTAGGDDKVLRGLIAAVRSGHLRMASDDPALATGLARAGVSGALPAGPAPVAFAVVVNAAGGKLDYFLDREVVYQSGPCRGSRRGSTIAVSLRNSAPATGLPPYATIRDVGGRLVDSTDNETLLTVYATRGSRLDLAMLDGEPIAVTGSGAAPHLSYRVESGLPSWQLQLTLPRKQIRRLVLQLVEPAVAGAARVPEQPLGRPLRRQVDVDRCG